MASQAMKIEVEHRLSGDLSVRASFELFIDAPEDADAAGERAAEAFTAFMEGYAKGGAA